MTNTYEIKSGVCTSRTLISNDNLEPMVRMINVSKEPVNIRSGTTVSELNEVEIVDVQSKPTDNEYEHLDVMMEKVDPAVPDEIRNELYELLKKYSWNFSKNEYDLGCAKGVQHHIDTGSAKPFRQTLRRHPDQYLPLIDEQVELMLQQGIIEPSKGAYSSNIVLVKKKDGSIRPYIDLRQLNQQVRESGNMDIYPLPNMGACLDSMGGSKWFSTFDLKAGYHQIEIYPPDAPKTTFLTRKGAWQYKRRKKRKKVVNKCGKWAQNYTGPFLITRMIGPVNAVIQKSKQSKPMVVHVDKLKHYKRDDLKSWLLLPKEIAPEPATTDNDHDPQNSTVIEPISQVVMPAEVAPEEVEQRPDRSHDIIRHADSDEVACSPKEIKLSPTKRPVRNRQKPARYRD